MKIYKYVKIDIDTGETIEEDSFEYSGPVALCGGGGDGGDGGGSSDGGGGSTAGGGASAGFGGAGNPGSMGGGNTAGSGAGGCGGGPGGSVGGQGGSSGGGDGSGGYGGFGGLGIGNPGSYGGQQSVGAPGFSGGYSDAGGVSGYSGSDYGKEAFAAAKNLAKMISKVKNPFAWGELPDNYSDLKGNLAAIGAMLGTMNLGDGTGLSSGVGGGGEGGGGEGIYNYLRGLAGQNQDAGLGSPTGLEAILKSMYAGDNPQFNLPEMMGDYTDRITTATDDYGQKSNEMMDEWKAFENEFFQIEDDYNQQMNNLPQLDMILPTGMGGGSVPLAPGAWANLAGQQAGGRADVLSQALPAMANRANIPMNQYKSQIGAADALMRPFDTAMNLYELDKSIQGDLDVAAASKPEDNSSIWDSLIPAAGYAVGSWLASE